jgi:hypothetical protein
MTKCPTCGYDDKGTGSAHHCSTEKLIFKSNTPESDTMKTLTELAKDNGADIGTWDKSGNGITLLSFTEAQLLATFNAWSAQQGWKLVPIEPTEEMIGMGCEIDLEDETPELYDKYIKEIYQNMIAASPLKG